MKQNNPPFPPMILLLKKRRYPVAFTGLCHCHSFTVMLSEGASWIPFISQVLLPILKPPAITVLFMPTPACPFQKWWESPESEMDLMSSNC